MQTFLDGKKIAQDKTILSNNFECQIPITQNLSNNQNVA